eukprot:3917173-Pyramimonas_sp.AAC.1
MLFIILLYYVIYLLFAFVPEVGPEGRVPHDLVAGYPERVCHRGGGGVRRGGGEPEQAPRPQAGGVPGEVPPEAE